ncbi:lysylphosphatidylglycerol synthase domain-containing protein [Dickeya lacustris]|uniref:lysylphosphatidylglycerol synthase domain-containing protein n=1 Tax=Dickeya lacustris TaxID=2259638 RepID=UPI000F65868D|nr:lysylphosphatidylglycerol synthase domain-containing protein [Dickeya lacustris]
MRRLYCYIGLLFLSIALWIWHSTDNLIETFSDSHIWGLLGISLLYLCSHLFRMMRLFLLTLDERDKAFPMLSAHVLTAFPSIFLPFKIGEIIRLYSFYLVYDRRQKAFAVWVAERFGDIAVITVFILGLYFLNVPVPKEMRNVCLFFVSASSLGLMALFAISRVSIYLNRHLVLNSHTRRGLLILKISYRFRQFELDVYKSLEGRRSGFMLLSVLIWTVEVLALSLFTNIYVIGQPDWATLFSSGLLASLPGNSSIAPNFGLYQSIAIIFLTYIFIGLVPLIARIKTLKVKHD